MSAVESNFKRVLQLATMLGIVVLGTLIWVRCGGSSFVEGCVFGLMGLGVIGFGLSELGPSADAVKAVIVDRNDPAMKFDRAKQRFADNLAMIVHLLQTHIRANSSYADSLTRANRDLPLLERPEQIRGVVVALIKENQNIQDRLNDLSAKLNDSVAQINQLNSSLADANDKAMRDPLTSLGNRRFFDLKLNEALIAARAESSELCLVVCDLDLFKTINDKFGHPVGDTVLKLFGKILSDNVKGKDAVARIGGEEFAIIFPSTNIVGAVTVAEQIRKQLEVKKWLLGSRGIALGTVTASFGVASLQAEEGTAELFQRADEALYRAKSEGRNRVLAALCSPRAAHTASVIMAANPEKFGLGGRLDASQNVTVTTTVSV